MLSEPQGKIQLDQTCFIPPGCIIHTGKLKALRSPIIRNLVEFGISHAYQTMKFSSHRMRINCHRKCPQMCFSEHSQKKVLIILKQRVGVWGTVFAT